LLPIAQSTFGIPAEGIKASHDTLRIEIAIDFLFMPVL